MKNIIPAKCLSNYFPKILPSLYARDQLIRLKQKGGDRQKTQVTPAMAQCRASVIDAGPALSHCWENEEVSDDSRHLSHTAKYSVNMKTKTRL